MEQLLLRVMEAAKVLGMGRSKIYDMIAHREIPAIRVGGSIRIPARELERWVDRRARRAAREIEVAQTGSAVEVDAAQQ